MMDLYLTILVRYVKFHKDVFPSKDLCPKQVACINDSPPKKTGLLGGRTHWVVNSSSQEILQFFSAWPAAQRERVGGLLSSCSKGDVQKADDSVRETW